MARKVEPITPERLTAVPANEVSRDDLDKRELADQRHKEAAMHAHACYAEMSTSSVRISMH
jgi:hypothetical protein